MRPIIIAPTMLLAADTSGTPFDVRISHTRDFVRVVLSVDRGTATGTDSFGFDRWPHDEFLDRPRIVRLGHRVGKSMAARLVLDALSKEARRERARARAVPPVHLHGEPELRVEALPPATPPAERFRPTLWFRGRQGSPRERTAPRARRRLRTWEREAAS